MQRASFWQGGGSDPGYHVLLEGPKIAATVNIEVPRKQGFSFVDGAGVRQALVDGEWFENHLVSLVGKLELDARSLPIMLSDTVILRFKSGSATGFHFALQSKNANGRQQVQPGIWASWLAPNPLHPESERAHVLSHEVIEWIADPFTNTRIPPTDFIDPFYGCYQSLEVADPLVFSPFYVNGYQLTDSANIFWFARQSPSIGLLNAVQFGHETVRSCRSRWGRRRSAGRLALRGCGRYATRTAPSRP